MLHAALPKGSLPGGNPHWHGGSGRFACSSVTRGRSPPAGQGSALPCPPPVKDHTPCGHLARCAAQRHRHVAPLRSDGCKGTLLFTGPAMTRFGSCLASRCWSVVGVMSPVSPYASRQPEPARTPLSAPAASLRAKG